MATIKATIFFEKRFGIGIFERIDRKGYSLARHIFDSEPSDSEIYEFVLNHYQELKLDSRSKAIVAKLKKIKRVKGIKNN